MAAGKKGLSAVPHRPDRALGIVRVSKEREGMIAPEVQQNAIEEYCRQRGYLLVTVVEGLDESGSRTKSAWWPRLDQACDAVEEGTYDVVVVWKFSRLARHRLKWATAIDRIETAGGRVESATEQVDTTTSTGRFTRGMLAEVQAWEAERLGEIWGEIHDRRVREGKPPTGKPKWGYVYDREQKLHVPDPVTGPALAECYRRYIGGASVYQLVRWLNAQGHVTLAGGKFSDHTLRRVLNSGFASGTFIWRGERVQGVHEALISPEEWQAYLDVHASRRLTHPRRAASVYPFSGLIRCARCGRPMSAGMQGSGRPTAKYRCTVAKEMGPEVCPGGYVEQSILEEAVIAWLRELARDLDVATVAELGARRMRKTAQSDAKRAAKQRKTAITALTRLEVSHAANPLPMDAYRAARAELDEQLAEITRIEERASRTARSSIVDPMVVARGLLVDWDIRPTMHKRAELSTILDSILVRAGRGPRRIVLVPTWETRP